MKAGPYGCPRQLAQDVAGLRGSCRVLSPTMWNSSLYSDGHRVRMLARGHTAGVF